MHEEKISSRLKALADPVRLQIIEMLSGGKMCACKILEKFSMTQPTLSYHMKILAECGLVIVEKDWKWSYYTLNPVALNEISVFFTNLSQEETK